MNFKDTPCAKCPRQAALMESLRHADIDLSMILPEIADRDMAKSVRNTLAMIDALRQSQQEFTQCEKCWQPATCEKYGCREAPGAAATPMQPALKLSAPDEEAVEEARDLANYLVARGIDNESAGRDFGPCIIITPKKRNQIVTVLRSLVSRPLRAEDGK